MHIESTTQTYLGNEIRCAHIVADEVCTWRFEKVLDVDGAYAWQFVIKADSEKTVTVLCGDQEQAFSVNDAFQHLTKVFHDVTIGDHPHVDVEFPVGEYYIGRTQLEHGTIVTDWQISMDDTASEVSKMWSSITQTAEEIRAEVHAAYNVVNHVPLVYSRQSASGEEWIPSNGESGLKWTLQENGSVLAEALTSGVATTAQSAYAITGYELTASVPPIDIDPLNQYTITGCPSDGDNESYYIRVRLFRASETPSSSIAFIDDQNQFYDYGEGVTIPTGFRYMTVHLVVTSGYVIPSGGITFWPMVVKGTEKVPYTMSGKSGTEMWSKIQQTANKISLVVTDSNNINVASIVTAINDNNESSVAIKADKIKLEGYTTINGSFHIDTTGKMIATDGEFGGTLKAATYTSSSYEDFGPFTAAELPDILSIAQGQTTATSADIEKYDVNKDGIVDYYDYYMIESNVNSDSGSGIRSTGEIHITPDSIGNLISIDYKATHITSGGIIRTDNPIRIGAFGLEAYGVRMINRAYSPYYSITDWYNNDPTKDVGFIRGTRTGIMINTSGDIDLSSGGVLAISANSVTVNGYQLGTYTYYGVDNVSVANETWTTLGNTITNNLFPAEGTYLITYTVQYEQDATGYRYSMITDADDATNGDTLDTRDVRMACNNTATYTKIVHFYTFSGAATKYFRVWQNSGRTLTCNLRVYVMKTS